MKAHRLQAESRRPPCIIFWKPLPSPAIPRMLGSFRVTAICLVAIDLMKSKAAGQLGWRKRPGSASEAKLRGRASRVRSTFCGIPLAQHPGRVHGGTSKQRLHTGQPRRRLHAGRECPGVAQGFGRANGRKTRQSDRWVGLERFPTVPWCGPEYSRSPCRERALPEQQVPVDAPRRIRPHRVPPIPDEARSRELTGDH